MPPDGWYGPQVRGSLFIFTMLIFPSPPGWLIQDDRNAQLAMVWTYPVSGTIQLGNHDHHGIGVVE
eukprot:193213-Hanusia_phi.AAC.1